MLRILTLIFLLNLTGCSYFVSSDELSRQIEQQMQREFDTNSAYQSYHLKVKDLKIIERKGLNIKGQASLQFENKPYTVMVQIFKDVQGYSWKIDETEFTFIDEVEMAKYQAQLDQELQNFSAELDHGSEEIIPEKVPESYVGLREETDNSDYTWTDSDEEPFPKGNITVNSH
ncbi:hypothetical protein B9T33_08295 [Acinetobacter sp. ANC 5054]|uniref:hypothetical protein n=1 Tax=Acinetobacter sp. ANC 5054 TaxID=1977877 RepID=UPI000A32FF9F|nr:hypothetical protein [Acinetobacter sp. ANC 5054]OTG80966.1 hypothetical protein B9T33_08295 [Acinetobacter sp. ANC 5054]